LTGPAKGYELAQFKEVFSRYTSTPLSKGNKATSELNQVVTPFLRGNKTSSVTFLKSPNTTESLGCYVVTSPDTPEGNNNKKTPLVTPDAVTPEDPFVTDNTPNVTDDSVLDLRHMGLNFEVSL
jgi:hypothetical protein